MKEKVFIYVGTYTHPIKFGTGQILDSKGKGIYLLELECETGKLNLMETFTNIINPSYLAVDEKGGFLYAVNELKEYQGKASGSVSAFKISKSDGKLTLINTVATNGTDPCHVILNPQRTHLFVSNFMSGSVALFPVHPDGSLGEACQFIQHEGSSVNPARQSGPHAHSLVFSPDGNFAFVPDLGIDKLMIYKAGGGTQPLAPAEVPFFKTKPGDGPRHCTFSPDGKYCYLINELGCTIQALEYNAKQGTFTELQTVSSLPQGVSSPGNTCADVHITPDGNYLYGSNRGHNSLIIYKIDKKTGKLDYVDCPPCGGKIPRNFAIDPSGKFLLCANQDSDDIVVFRIDQGTGKLTETSRIGIPTAVCVIPAVF